MGPAGATEPTDGIIKLKYGADLSWHPLPWLAPALRFDRLQPNREVPEQSFAVLSPRIVFETDWITHEQITIQYSRYFYNQRTCEPGLLAACAQPAPDPARPDGFGAFSAHNDGDRGSPLTAPNVPARPDQNVVRVEATFWW